MVYFFVGLIALVVILIPANWWLGSIGVNWWLCQFVMLPICLFAGFHYGHWISRRLVRRNEEPMS